MPETCCTFIVGSFRHRWTCPRCGTVWAWDDEAIEWVRCAQIDGDADVR